MKKIIIVTLALMSVLACEKKDDSISNQVPDIEKKDPVEQVLGADKQRERLRDTGEEMIDAIDVESIKKSMRTVMELEDLDFKKYSEGKAVTAVYDAIEGMMTMSRYATLAVYNLRALKGSYSFVNGVQNVTESDNISINYENRWTAELTFSENTRKVQIVNTDNVKEYVEMPSHIDAIVSKDNGKVVSVSIDFDSDITGIISELNLVTSHTFVSGAVEFAGYKLCMAKVGYCDSSAVCNSYLAKGEEILYTEKITVNKFEISNSGIKGAGAGDFELDILGKVQVKAKISDVAALVDNVNNANINNGDETVFKSYVSKVNSLIDNGVYFSSDVKQCSMELYPFESISYNKWWYMQPVLVLADGTRYDNISDFFTKQYFGSVIDKFESILESLQE